MKLVKIMTMLPVTLVASLLANTTFANHTNSEEKDAINERKIKIVEEAQEVFSMYGDLRLNEIDGVDGPQTKDLVKEAKRAMGWTVSDEITENFTGTMLNDLYSVDEREFIHSRRHAAIAVSSDGKVGLAYGFYTSAAATIVALRRCQWLSNQPSTCLNSLVTNILGQKLWYTVRMCHDRFDIYFGHNRAQLIEHTYSQTHGENCRIHTVIHTWYGQKIDAHEKTLLSD